MKKVAVPKKPEEGPFSLSCTCASMKNVSQYRKNPTVWDPKEIRLGLKSFFVFILTRNVNNLEDNVKVQI